METDVNSNIKAIIPPPTSIEFGKSLLGLRKKLGLSQDEMADYLGVPKRTYIYWEHDERQPNANVAYWLGKVADLLEDDNANDNNQIDKLLEITTHLQGEIAKLRLKHNKETAQ